MRKTKRILYSVKLLSVIVVFSSFSPARSTNNKPEYFLFKINRNRDADEIWYTLNLNKRGLPDNNQPIEAFWVRKTKNNETEPLTWIQNKYSYGIHVIRPYDAYTKSMKFRFVSFDHQTFELRKTPEGEFKVYTDFKNRELEVTRVFVQIDGGSFWVPSVPYVKIIGYYVGSSDLVAQTITL